MDSQEVDRLRAVLDDLPEPVTFLANLFAHSPVGFAIFTADGGSMLTNGAFVDLFGSSPPPEYNILTDSVAKEQGLSDLIRRGLHGNTVELPTFWYDAGQVENIDVPSKRVAIQMTIFPIFNDSKQVAFVAATYKDQTELMTHRDELEETVSNRTAELRSAIVDLESFAGAVSHDLAAPLRSVTAFSEALKSELGDDISPRAAMMLDTIVGAGIDMNETMRALLRLARVTQEPLRRSDVDVGAMAHAVVDQLLAAEPAREVDVSIACHGITAEADRDLVIVLLENLIGNAWKYSSKNPQAHVEVGAQAKDEQPIVFYVKDNGAGFDMAHADRLFEPFQRLHAAREFSGTGIGLATAKRIARRHGGRIWADSEVGSGATFYFTLEPEPLPA